MPPANRQDVQRCPYELAGGAPAPAGGKPAACGLSRRAVAASLAAPFLGRLAGAAAVRPHIVLFLADDHGWDIAGCYGNRAVRTPNIDRLASQGLRFTRAFAASPTCSPSRAVLYTGLHSPRNGLMGNHTDCKPGIQSLAQYMKALGYRTVLANKTHVKPPEVFDFEYLKATLPPVPGRQRRYRAEGLDTAMVDRLLAAHAADHKDVPLLLILADNSPHVIWEPNRIYDPQQLPLPPIAADTPVTRAAMANYYQDITTADQHLGEVMNSLQRHGFEPNTLLIYTSDQGPEWPRSKWTVYDAGLRVPFIARWPGRIRPNTVTDAMISFVDVTPTILDAAGGKPIPGLDGSSFLDVLLGRKRSFRQEIYATHSGDGQMNRFPQRAIRDTRYKYILNLHPERKWTTHFTLVAGIPQSHKQVWDSWVEKAQTDAATARLIRLMEDHPREELYDTRADPYEMNNLAGQPEMQERLGRMRRRLAQLRKQLGDIDE